MIKWWYAPAWGLTSLGWSVIYMATHVTAALVVAVAGAILMISCHINEDNKDGD